MSKPRALLVDLNNLARYPTLSIGYLVAALRAADMEVEVLSPLTHGVPPSVRERPQTLKMYARQRAMFAMHPLVTPVRDRARTVYSARKQAPSERVLLETRAAVAERRPDVLLLSAYLGHQPSVAALCELAAERGHSGAAGWPRVQQPRHRGGMGFDSRADRDRRGGGRLHPAGDRRDDAWPAEISPATRASSCPTDARARPRLRSLISRVFLSRTSPTSRGISTGPPSCRS